MHLHAGFLLSFEVSVSVKNLNEITASALIDHFKQVETALLDLKNLTGETKSMRDALSGVQGILIDLSLLADRGGE